MLIQERKVGKIFHWKVMSLLQVIPILKVNTFPGSYITAQKRFQLRITSVNVTKSAVSCRFGHIY